MVKRVGNLMERIASRENLHEAFLRAARGKSGKMAVVKFRNHLDDHLKLMQEQLLDGTYRFGQYQFFTIHDPKKREICAASFPDRVVFHAMMRICHPVFDNYQDYDSYASRIGKGTYKALERAQQYARQYQWFAKLDVCHYFESIDHQVMMQQLCRLFKDPQLLLFFQCLLNDYHSSPGKGLPIGNLTSQYFANHYLSVADHYAKQQLRVPGLVRYMDDVLLFSNDKHRLLHDVGIYIRYVENELKLQLHDPVVNRTSCGIPFLGYVVYGNGLRLNRRSKLRFREKMAALAAEVDLESINQQEYAMRGQCMLAFVRKAQTDGFLRNMVQTTGVYPLGL